jgi:hypothetical protein
MNNEQTAEKHRGLNRVLENAGFDYFFSWPAPLFVKALTADNVSVAVRAFCAQTYKEQFKTYAALESSQE